MPLDAAALRRLTHERLTFNAPLSESRADDLLLRLRLPPGGRVLDLGCGRGELLLRLCETYDAPGDGVELDADHVAHARAAATERGLEHAVSFHAVDVRDWSGDRADVVVSVGTSHAWGGPAAALAALRGHVTDNGLVLVGEGVWDSEPPAAAREIFGDLPNLLGLTDLATAADFRPLYVGSSSLDEFDAWESDWRAGLELSGLPEARELADRRRVEYLRSYRGVLGFAWLILTPG